MNIRRYIFAGLIITTTSYYGATVAYADNCTDALKKVPSLSSLKGAKLSRQEDLILQMCSDGPAGRVVRGDRYERSADLKQASAEYRAALAEITRDVAPDNNIRQGDKHLLAHEFRKAIKSYKQALKEQPDWTEALMKLADAHMAAGNDDEAIEVLRKCLRLNENNTDARYSLGVIYKRKGLLADAEAELRASLKSGPDNIDAHRHLADVYIIRGDFQQAIQEYRVLLDRDNDNFLLHFKLAQTYERSKRYKDAIAEYKISVQLAPDSVEANKELAILYEKTAMLDKAAHHYRETLRLKNDDRNSRNALTGIYVKQKKYDALLALLKDETKQFPKNPDSYYRLGLMLYFMKDFDAAQQEYSTAVTLKPNHAKALNGLAKIAMIKGDNSEARKYLLASQKADPKLLEAKQMLNDLKEEDPFQPEPQKIKIRTVKKKKVKSIKKSVSSKKKSVKSLKKAKTVKKKPVKSSKKNVKKNTGMTAK